MMQTAKLTLLSSFTTHHTADSTTLGMVAVEGGMLRGWGKPRAGSLLSSNSL